MREILNLFDIGIVLNKCLSKIIFSIVIVFGPNVETTGIFVL